MLPAHESSKIKSETSHAFLCTKRLLLFSFQERRHLEKQIYIGTIQLCASDNINQIGFPFIMKKKKSPDHLEKINSAKEKYSQIITFIKRSLKGWIILRKYCLKYINNTEKYNKNSGKNSKSHIKDGANIKQKVKMWPDFYFSKDYMNKESI